ncbi:beta-galactosidase/beta-glucuronidase [Chthonomonas calidirosea]|uniref:beta-mannosidase n=1 Tax=Chthonomonas calidirosea TaxID=454171 RepID=UPI0006DD4B09|nr:glycoside hydrolase family 2 protein [Chthonomonas calidirosea]CEK14273.1 beta-galactosidase/beta-glucuronidase [Chthonomonas calidirosea]
MPFSETVVGVHRRSLATGAGAVWRFREVPRQNISPSSQLDWMPASVPGFVHLDLLRQKAIPHPYTDLQERSVQWVDERDWEYEGVFYLESLPDGMAYLCFEGLDTVAEIELNGQPLGAVDNMFSPHEFEVRELLTCGTGEIGRNVLRVRFYSALRVGRERLRAWGESGNVTLPEHWFLWGPRAFVRKAQYMFGWDWGPELVSCGIWKDVRLLFVPIARLLHLQYQVLSLSEERAVVRFRAEVERNPQQSPHSLTLKVKMIGKNGTIVGQTEVPSGPRYVQASLDLTVENPQLWWPNGCVDERERGTSYRTEWMLECDGQTVDVACCQTGLRKIELVRQSDEYGESFEFLINGRKLFVKGANWIPASSFPEHLPSVNSSAKSNKVYSDKVYNLLRQAADAGVNMLRVWGGGLYESEQFYSLCDQFGILVWQDFPYACSYYPDTGEYEVKAIAEARAAVRRLRLHPSLALWCGNNENQQMHHDGWVGRSNLPVRFLGDRLYEEILPKIVAEEDPDRPYWPGSPYGGENPNSEEMGDRHNWNVWHGAGDWVHYREDKGRFISEFGFASSCSLTCWERWLSSEMRWAHSPAVRWHDKTRKGYETYLGLIALHFPYPRQLEELVYYSQLNQAEALRCGIEHWRRSKQRCRGTLFWQWNDCWPVQSWSVIDYEGVPKAAYYAIKRAYAPLVISLFLEDNVLVAWIVQDSAKPLQGVLNVQVCDFWGQVLLQRSYKAQVAADSAMEVGRFALDLSAAARRESFAWGYFEGTDGEHSEALILLCEPKDIVRADPGLEWELAGSDNLWTLALRSQRFAPYVWLRLGNGAHGRFSDNFFCLRPGEQKQVSLELEGVPVSEEVIRQLLHIRTF